MKIGQIFLFLGGPVCTGFDTSISGGPVWIPVITGMCTGASVHRLQAEKRTSKPQIRGEIGQSGLWERKLTLDYVLRHVLHGSKPQITHKIKKSVRSTNFGAILGDFQIFGGNHKSVTNPWQPKAADTI